MILTSLVEERKDRDQAIAELQAKSAELDPQTGQADELQALRDQMRRTLPLPRNRTAVIAENHLRLIVLTPIVNL